MLQAKPSTTPPPASATMSVPTHTAEPEVEPEGLVFTATLQDPASWEAEIRFDLAPDLLFTSSVENDTPGFATITLGDIYLTEGSYTVTPDRNSAPSGVEFEIWAIYPTGSRACTSGLTYEKPKMGALTTTTRVAEPLSIGDRRACRIRVGNVTSADVGATGTYDFEAGLDGGIRQVPERQVDSLLAVLNAPEALVAIPGASTSGRWSVQTDNCDVTLPSSFGSPGKRQAILPGFEADATGDTFGC